MDNVLKQDILQRCIALKNDVSIVQDKAHGICNAVKYNFGIEAVDEIQQLLNSIFVKWPEYSGNEYYPVPDPDWDDDRYCEKDAAYRAYENAGIETMWHGPYGEARMRLLDFIIQTLSEELHNAV